MQNTQKNNVKLIELYDIVTNKLETYILELDLVGKGFYGAVYKAVHQHNPNMEFAVKVINLQRQQTREQILQELQIIKQIPKSPNLVDTHKQHLQSQKNLYIFQEYCEGGSLSEWKDKYQGRPKKESEVFDLFYQLGRGYLDLYNAGIVHEDIKPSNILIKGKLYKYCDFGVSQLVSKLKQQESRKGTVSYMPPQKLSSKFIPSAKSDIYSLGVTLYEVIFGFHPYLKQKTKNAKEYLGILKSAQLAPTHQLLKNIYNPSLKFNKLIEIIEGMIALKPDLRLSIQELKDILFNQEPFKDMKIPVENESSRVEVNKYANFVPSPYDQKSRIFMVGEDLEQQNRLINQSFKVQIQDKEYKSAIEESLRMSKLKHMQKSSMIELLVKQYELLKNVITYLTNGVKYLSEVYKAVEKQDPTCRGLFFVGENLHKLQGLQNEKVTQVIQFFILKFNCLIMKSFSKSIENYSELFELIKIWQDIEYLEAEVSKFIADQNIQNIDTKRALIAFGSNLSIEEFCQLLQKEFELIFKKMVFENSLRINFKEDLINGLFLLHVNDVLSRIQKLKGVCEGENVSVIPQVSQEEEMNQLEKIITEFNQWRKFRIGGLKAIFYQQFKDVEGVMYDAEENSDSFVDIKDIMDELEEEEKQNKTGNSSTENSPSKK